MSLTKDLVKERRYLHVDGNNHTTTIADKAEDEVFKAYIEFAYYHTINDAVMYEKAVLISRLKEQKALFSQLSCRKRDVLNKLKVNRSNTAIALTLPQETGRSSSNSYQPDMDTITFFTLEDAFDFAYQREKNTLALYDKLQKTAHYPLSKTLFDYLKEIQFTTIEFLDAQLSIANGTSCPVMSVGVELEQVPG